MFKPEELFDLSQTEHASIFSKGEYPWEAIKAIKPYLRDHLRPGQHHHESLGTAYIGHNVFIGKGTVIEAGAMIKGPAIIGRNCEIRHNAYIRDNVIVGDDCVIGNASELKNAFLLNGCQVPHFNYVGDSILGHKAHLGAGVKISNVKLSPGNIVVDMEGIPYDTGLRKFGALIGDHTEIGCNGVLNPGSILGRSCLIYPNVLWRGILPANRIVKNKANTEVIAGRPQEPLG